MSLSVAEDLLTPKHEALQAKRSIESGLLLAQLSPKGATLVRFLPTPPQEEGKPASVDAGWMRSHAEQVERMLPGGLAVVGAYVSAPGAKLAALEAKVQPLLTTLQAQQQRLVGGEPREAVLLLLPADSKKASCKTLAVGGARLQPTELKTARAAPQLHCFTTDVQLDFTMQLHGGAPQREQFRAEAAPHVAAIEASLARVGALALGGPFGAVATTAAELGTSSVQAPHRVQLFADPAAKPAAAAAEAAAPYASVRLRGVVHARAFCGAKDEVAWAVEALKRDAGRSLDARLELLLDEIGDDDDDEDDDEGGGAELALDAGSAWALPRRANVEVEGGFSVCDYVGAREAPSECAERLEMFVGHKLGDGLSDAEIDALLGPEEIGSMRKNAPPGAAPPAPPPAAAAPKAAPKAAAAKAAASPAAAGGSPPWLVPAIAVAVIAVALAAANVLGLLGERGEPEIAAAVLDTDTEPEAMAAE